MVRLESLVDLETGRFEYDFTRHASLVWHFRHKFYDVSNQPQNHLVALDDIVFVRVETALLTHFEVTCEGPLVSNEVSYDR